MSLFYKSGEWKEYFVEVMMPYLSQENTAGINHVLIDKDVAGERHQKYIKYQETLELYVEFNKLISQLYCYLRELDNCVFTIEKNAVKGNAIDVYAKACKTYSKMIHDVHPFVWDKREDCLILRLGESALYNELESFRGVFNVK